MGQRVNSHFDIFIVESPFSRFKFCISLATSSKLNTYWNKSFVKNMFLLLPEVFPHIIIVFFKEEKEEKL